MALDGLVIHALTEELQILTGGRISRIHQPNGHDIVMQIRAQGENLRLLLSANPTYPRVHLTKMTTVNPLEAPMFCMLLRKHCENGTIQSFRQIGTERILHLEILHRDELGDLSIRTLVIELMGRHSNIILLDPETNTILDGIHHVTPAISSYRIVMPGSIYTAPPEQHKLNPFETNREQLAEAIGTPDEPSVIVNAISGLSPLVAKEILHRSPDAPADELYSVIQSLKLKQASPNIITRTSGKSDFSVISLTHLNGEKLDYDTVSDCLEAYYGDKAERDTIKQRVSDLLRMLQNERNKNVTKLEKLRNTLESAQEADLFRIRGELLTASLHLVNKGDKQIDVVNYYDEEQRMVTISLDPQLSPSENAQRQFKKYTKMKNSVHAVNEQIESTEVEIRYIEELLQQLADASITDIEEIREELIEQGYVKRRGKAVKNKKKSNKPLLTCYLSSEGVSIYVGKNNTQNEYLTNRFAAPNDTWLHTKDIPGSHVIIRGDHQDETLHEAAMLAAYYSQAKSSSQVPVDYTLIRHVRKPNGSKPGFVIYDKQKTLYVTPDEQRVKSMKLEVKS